MKTRPLATLLIAALLLAGFSVRAADSEAKTALDAVVAQINAKIKDGKKSPDDLKSELAEFDKLLTKFKGEKSEDVARIAYMKATLYLAVFQDEPKGTELLTALQRDFPETKWGKTAESRLKSLKAQENMAVGKQFPDFTEKDHLGKPLALSAYKGKVVLIDFWATWCGPCVRELPNVKKAYSKHHPGGFEIIGISLDSDRDKLTSFIEKQEMPWQEFFDGEGWKNKLAQQYGINSIPATYLLDRDGKVIAKNLRGDALEAAVSKALEKAK